MTLKWWVYIVVVNIHNILKLVIVHAFDLYACFSLTPKFHLLFEVSIVITLYKECTKFFLTLKNYFINKKNTFSILIHSLPSPFFFICISNVTFHMWKAWKWNIRINFELMIGQSNKIMIIDNCSTGIIYGYLIWMI